MTLRLTDEQSEALRNRAQAEHRSMQQVDLAAIEAYVRQPAARLQRREAVEVGALLEAFGELPPIEGEAFRADQGRHVDGALHLDASERTRGPTERG